MSVQFSRRRSPIGTVEASRLVASEPARADIDRVRDAVAEVEQFDDGSQEWREAKKAALGALAAVRKDGERQ